MGKKLTSNITNTFIWNCHIIHPKCVCVCAFYCQNICLNCYRTGRLVGRSIFQLLNSFISMLFKRTYQKQWFIWNKAQLKDQVKKYRTLNTMEQLDHTHNKGSYYVFDTDFDNRNNKKNLTRAFIQISQFINCLSLTCICICVI